MSSVLIAIESFTTEVDGEIFVVNREETRVDSEHPLAKAHPQHFKPVDEGVTYPVESATAAPGEKRETAKKEE